MVLTAQQSYIQRIRCEHTGFSGRTTIDRTSGSCRLSYPEFFIPQQSGTDHGVIKGPKARTVARAIDFGSVARIASNVLIVIWASDWNNWESEGAT